MFQDKYNFSSGEPHFEVDKKIIQEIQNHVSGNCNYISVLGLNKLRDKCAKYEEMKIQKIKYTRENIIIGNGVSGLLSNLIGMYVKDNMSVLVIEPYYFSYLKLLEYRNCKIFYLNERFETIPYIKDLKIILFSNPSNPTGYCFSHNQLKQIADYAKKNNVLIISDEIYSEYDYENKFSSIRLIYKDAIVLKGFSKSYSMTGMRLGYAIAPSNIINELAEFQLHSNICIPEAIQWGGVKALDISIKDWIDYYKNNRDYIFNELKNYISLELPQGGLYYFLDIGDEDKFCNKAEEYGMIFRKGSNFCKKNNFVRMSFAVDKNFIEYNMSNIKKCIECSI